MTLSYSELQEELSCSRTKYPRFNFKLDTTAEAQTIACDWKISILLSNFLLLVHFRTIQAMSDFLVKATELTPVALGK